MMFMINAISGEAVEKLHLFNLGQHIAESEFAVQSVQLAYIPLKTRRMVASPGHQRWKADDFSAEVRCAWSSGGLHISFNIRDREVHNNAVPKRFWSEDCLEILLDVREKPTAEYTGNSIHIFVAPPQNGNSRRFYIRDNRDPGKDFFCRSALTDRGWCGNVFVPWSTFPGFEAKTGVEIGLGVQVSDDYGRPADNPFFNAQVMRFGSNRMPRDASLLPRWVLAEKFEPSEKNDLANVMAVDVPNIIFSGRIEADIIIAEPFKKDVAFIEWECVLADRELSGTANLDKLIIDLPAGVYGNGTVKLKIYNEQKQILGVLILPFTRFNGEELQKLQQTVTDLIKKADLPALAEKSPEKIAGYFGLLNNYEQLKRMIFLEKTSDIDQLVEEMKLRIQLLQGEPLKTDNNLFRLLQISASQDAQVSVEYPRYHPDNRRMDDALIKFYCGSIPLARVKVIGDAKCTANQRRWVPALYSRQMMPIENKEHLLFFFSVGGTRERVYMTDINSLDGVRNIDAVVIADNAPAAHAGAVRQYAASHSLPIISEKSLSKGMQVLYAGRPDPESAIGKLFKQAYKLVWTTAGRNDLILEFENGLCAHIRCISAAGCELIAEALTARRSFTRQDSRLLTRAVADELAKCNIIPTAVPENVDLMAADVHCHTIYSDGLLTPLGLVAAALYSQMDFLMIADHETASGVLDLQEKFIAYGFKFPLLAGEENSLPDGHFNSYPVTESIPFGLSLAELIKTAHKQGASVQYNHPATYSNRRDFQRNGIAGTGLEAWEHEMPPYAAEWQELPALIGSSDNHNSAFPTERTLTYVEKMDGKTFQTAVRQKKTGMLEAISENFIYGSVELKGMLLTALQNPEKYLLAPYYRRLQEFLSTADIAGLFKYQPGATPEELGLQ